jgi:hypothetical protein
MIVLELVDNGCVWRRRSQDNFWVGRLEGDKKVDQKGLFFQLLLFFGPCESAYGSLRSRSGLGFGVPKRALWRDTNKPANGARKCSKR